MDLIRMNQTQNRDDWIRTSGPFVPNEVRYQAAPHPVIYQHLLIYIPNRRIVKVFPGDF
jgi:hypothetical protein